MTKTWWEVREVDADARRRHIAVLFNVDAARMCAKDSQLEYVAVIRVDLDTDTGTYTFTAEELEPKPVYYFGRDPDADCPEERFFPGEAYSVPILAEFPFWQHMDNGDYRMLSEAERDDVLKRFAS